MPLGASVCECAIEMISAVQKHMKSSLQHSRVLFPRPLSPTRSKRLASVVSVLDFTRAVRMEPHLPDPHLPGDTNTRLHFPSQRESFALLFLSYVLYPQEDLSALLWTSGPGF